MGRAYMTSLKMTSIALSLILLPVLVHAESDNKISFAIGLGFSVQNVYEGSSSYIGVLIPLLETISAKHRTLRLASIRSLCGKRWVAQCYLIAGSQLAVDK
ncbi:TPA: hypothetical protein R4X15_004909 [Citrobacter amalonaticus]|nr:hypothetical protein [Citrobacter amalonaticus]HED1793709.1 hypothetical protein [Citrobacter amalonaticus]